MSTTTRKRRAYVDHFLPREVGGPVIVVFSLEGVIAGIFTEYVPTEDETLGWALVFLLSIVVAYWSSVDEQAREGFPGVSGAVDNKIPPRVQIYS